MAILGPHADEEQNDRYAAQKASEETYRLNGRDQFFAWFIAAPTLCACKIMLVPRRPTMRHLPSTQPSRRRKDLGE